MKVTFMDGKPVLTLIVFNSDALPGRGHSIIIGRQRYIVTALTWSYEPTGILLQSHRPSVQIDLKKDIA